MRRYVWLLGLLTACDGGETVESVDPGVQEPVVQEPVVQEPTFDEKVSVVHGLSLSGQHAEALKQAEALLGENPDEDGLWRVLAREAAAGDAQQALFDRLDAANPIGGRADAHHSLRAELALDLGQHNVALEAAQAAGNDALIARALMSGATLAVDPEAELTAAQALYQQLTSEKAVDDAVAASADSVTGWRAAMLRATVAQEAGDTSAALAALESASDSPRGVLAANMARVSLALSGGEGAPSLEQAIGWASEAATSAVEDGDGAGLSSAMSAIVSLHQATLQPAEGLESLAALHQSVIEAYGGEAGSLSGVVLAQSQLINGMPVEAHQTASEARALLTERPEAASAAWVEGWAAYQLGRVDAISTAAESSEGAQKQALEALAAQSSGAAAGLEHPFPTAGLSDRDQAMVSVEAARTDAVAGIEHLRRAVDAADETGDAALKVYTRLAYEAAARAAGRSDAASMRVELLKLFPEPPAGLAAEVAVRDALDGGSAAISGDVELIQVWSALANGTPAPTGLTGEGTAALSTWATGRAGGGASAYNEALASIPVHRQGALSLYTVLDGSQGTGFHADLAKIGNELTDLDVALSCHELGHRVNAVQDDVSLGRDLTRGVPEKEREALLAAVALARAEMLSFHLGAAWPEEALASVAASESAAAASSPAFERLMPLAGTSIADLRENQPGTSFLSYVDVNGSIHGLVVTPDGGAQRMVGNTDRIFDLAIQHYDALAASATVDGFANHIPGNQLRLALIDSFAQELTGFGRYQIVAPTELLAFSFTTFPEQASGLRWLADIRTIAQVPSLKTLAQPKIPVELYVPDFLGVGTPVEPAPEPSGEEGELPVEVENPDKPKLKVPTDLGLASRHFGSDFRVMLLGEDATAERYIESSATARYIYIADVDSTTDGGFQIVGGEMNLSEIRTHPIPAKVVFISAPAPSVMQVHRARAFLDAGAEAVVVVNWDIPESSMRRFVDGFFEALNRDRPPARALGDARSSLLRDALMGEEARDPALWGSIVLYGAP
jgi:hypothetical protein